MQEEKITIRTFVAKNKKILIATILSLILVVAGAITLTLALFNDKEDRTININFHNETVTIDAEINPEEQMFSSDVTLLKLFQPSEEVPSLHLLNSAQVTILLSDYEALGVRFKIGFEYHDNVVVSNEDLKLILSYLNNKANFGSLISATPYLTYSWKQINSASGDNYYYLCNSANAPVYLNTTTQSYSLNVIDGVVNYAGINALNLDLSAFSDETKKIFEKLSLTLQIEVCPQGSSYEFISPTYTYGKVAVFDSQGGTTTPAKLLSGDNITLPETTKLGQVFGGWCDSLTLTNVLGQANASISQTNSVQTYYAKFTPATYDITLDPAGGKLLITNSNAPYVISGVTYGSPFLATSALTIMEGRDFLGYYDENDICYIDTKGNAIRDWDKTQSETLTARYSAPYTFDIIYSGIENAYFKQDTVYQYTCQITQIVIPDPFQDGYTFDGWTVRVGNTELTNQKMYEITASTMGTIYLHANFSPITYTATFADGESSLNFSMETPLILHTLNKIYSGYEVIEAEGGWQIGEKYPASQAITKRYGNVKFKKTISVEALMLDTQSLEATVDPMVLGLGTTGQIVLPDAVRDGYIFTGWYREPNCQTLVNRICDVDELIADIVADAGSNEPEYVLYAGWTSGTPKYTVTLHNNSADTADSTIYFNQNAGNKQNFVVPNSVTIPTKSGYTFAGYFSEPNSQGIKFFDAEGNAVFTDFSFAFVSDYAYNYDLYATYTENTYQITFDSQGGASVSSIFYTPNTAEVVYPLTTKFGYDFEGWTIQTASGNWTAGNLDLATAISTQGKNGDVTLVARFTPKTYTITFNYLFCSSTNPITISANSSSLEYNIATASLDLNYQAITGDANLTGHNFIGWKVAVGLGSWVVGSNIAGSSLTLQNSYYGNVVLVAEYELVTYELKFQYVDASGNVLTGEKYANATKSIFFTYQNSQITLREHAIEVGINYSAWKPKANNGGWLTSNSYSAGQQITLAQNQYVNGVILSSTVSTYFERGTGNADDPFIISNATQLKNLSSLIESDTTYSLYNSLSYALGHANGQSKFGGEGDSTGFTLSGTFESIGDETKPFKGTFNGNNYEIRNLTTTTNQMADSGLFGVAIGAKIINVVLMGPKITATAKNAGGLVSTAADGTYIENCHIKTSSSYVGSGTFSQVYSGMIAGQIINNVVMKNCSNAVSVTFNARDCGGIVGSADRNSILLDLKNSGTITVQGNADVSVAGICGYYGTNTSNNNQAGSCFAMNLYNSGAINCTVNANYIAGCIGFKGYGSFVFNAYSDGVITHNGSYKVNCRVIGHSQNGGQNEETSAANGLLNRYYKSGSVPTNLNSIDGHSLTESQIAGTTPKENLVTDYEIFNTHSFASLATLLNVWIYDLQQQQRGDGGLVPPVHYVYGNATGTTYSSLNEYISALGINKEELHYWQTNTTKKTAELNQEDIANMTLALTYVDLCGGTLNGDYSRVYAKLLSGNSIRYQDSEKIYVTDFIRSGYKFQGLYLNAQGEGTPLTQSSDSNGAYYNITVDNSVGLLTYYAVWTPIFSEGSGTADDPFIITSGEQLKALADVTNNGTYMADGTTLYASAYYHQPIAIHMENVTGFTPIGTYAHPFTGTYYGYNQWIYGNLLYANDATNNVGLFGRVENATIKAVRINFKQTIIGNESVGGIVGTAMYSNLINLYNEASHVQGNWNVGGIAGYISNCLVLNCWSRANVTSIKNSGGVVGHAQYSTIENCAVNNSSYSIKTTTSSTTDVAIGGVVGRITSSKVLNCYNDLNVSPAVATDYSGRVVGRVANNDTVNNLISYCYYRSNITGERNVGSNATYATVNNIYPYNKDDPLNFTDGVKSIEIGSNTFKVSSLFMMMNLYVEAVNMGKPLVAGVDRSQRETDIEAGDKETFELSFSRVSDFTYQPGTYTSYARQVTFITDTEMVWGRYARDEKGNIIKEDGVEKFVNYTTYPYHYASVGTTLSIPSTIPEYALDSPMVFAGWYKLNADGSFTQVIGADNKFVDGNYLITKNECFVAKWTYQENLIISARNTTYNGLKQTLLSVQNDGGITRYCEVTEANKNTNPFDSNVNAGQTSIPTGTDAKTYYIYYYKKPASANATTGLVTVTIAPKDISSTTVSGVNASYTYTGSEISPSITVKISASATDAMVVETDYSIDYSDNINVGQASITLTGKGNFTGTKVVTFLITKATNGTSVTAKSLTYNATEQVLINVSGVPAGAEIRYSLTADLNATNYLTGTTTIPSAINAGTYKVSWYVAEIDNFEAKGGSVSVTIAKRKISYAVISTLENKVYTGSNITQSYSVTDSISGTLAKGSDYTEAWTDNTDVGTATLTITGIGNYEGTKTATFQITSAKNPVVVTANVLSYNGKAQNLVSVTNAKGTMYYSTTTELTSATNGSTTIPTATNAGSYTVYYFCAGDGNYGTAKGSVNVTMAKRNISNATLTLKSSSVSYNGSARTVEFTVTDSVPNTNTTLVEGTHFNVSWSNNTNVGDAKIIITGKGNYEGSEEGTFRIISARNTFSVSGLSVVYNGQSQTLVKINSEPQGDVYFNIGTELNADNHSSIGTKYTGSSTLPKMQNAGLYEIYYYVAGNTNYDAVSGHVTSVIQKASNAINLSTETLTYNGKAQNLIQSASATSNTTIYYSLDNILNSSNYTSSGSSTIPARTNAGTYTIYSFVPESANYGEASQTKSVVINPRNISYATCSIPEQMFTGSEVKPSYEVYDSVPNANTKLTNGTDYTGLFSNNSAVGTAKLTLTGNGNYTGTKEISFQIIQAENTVSISARTSLEYNNTDQALVEIGNAGIGDLYFSLTTALNNSNYASGTKYTGFESIPTGKNAGNYSVHFYSVGDVSHKSVSGSISVTIAQRNISNASVSDLGSHTYTGNAITPTFSVTDNVGGQNVVLKDSSAQTSTSFTYVWGNNTNSGNETATLTLTGTGNYNGTQIVKFTINKKANSLVLSAKTGLVYNGKAQDLITVSTNGEGGTYFSINTPLTETNYASSGSTSLPKGTNALNYTVYYYSPGTTQGVASKSGNITVTISPRNLSNATISAFANSSVVYTGSEIVQNYTVTDSVPNANTTLTNGTSYTADWTSNTDVGTAKLIITGKGNYTGTKTATFTITSATITASVSQNGTLTYNGTAQTPELNQSATLKGGQTATWKFATTSNAVHSTTVPTYTNAGSYTLYYEVSAPNHTTLKSSCTITIGKANITASLSQNGYLVANGSAQTPSLNKSATTVNNQTASWTYCTTQNGTYTSTVPTFTNAGTYTLYFKVSAPNHNDKAGSCTIIVQAKLATPSSLSWSGGTANWGTVSNASSYNIQLYNGSSPVTTVTSSSTSYNFSSNLLEAASTNWTFKVQAIPSSNLYANSEYATSGANASYKVTFNANGGTCSVSSVIVIKGQSTTTPTATRSNCTFAHWGTSQTASSGIAANSSITPTASITYYAVWYTTVSVTKTSEHSHTESQYGVSVLGNVKEYDSTVLFFGNNQVNIGDVEVSILMLQSLGFKEISYVNNLKMRLVCYKEQGVNKFYKLETSGQDTKAIVGATYYVYGLYLDRGKQTSAQAINIRLFVNGEKKYISKLHALDEVTEAYGGTYLAQYNFTVTPGMSVAVEERGIRQENSANDW